ncbi:MAG: protein kinase [Anaerolineales bacterium]|nr:protein kinase [Anaerolineales bacterium]
MPTPTLNIGPYLYLPRHQLDETKMSTIWVAQEQRASEHNRAEENQVVLKIARLSDKQYSLTNQRAIENEEKWLMSLRHPNVIRLRPIAEVHSSRQQVYRARSDLPGNPWFLVTDFLPGGDLSSLLTERRRLSSALAIEIVEQVGNALVYIHQHNCVHCDIKPRNILFRRKPTGDALTLESQPVVIDFGIAKNPIDGKQLVSGTPRWITPEMAEAMRVVTKLEVDSSWDVYALGLVLYNAITGRKPRLDVPGPGSWDRITPADLQSDHTVSDAPALAAELNRLLLSATATAASERVSAATFLNQTQQLRRYVRVSPQPAGQQRPAPDRRTGWWVLGALTAAALLFFAVVWLNQRPTGVLPSPDPQATPPISATDAAGGSTGTGAPPPQAALPGQAAPPELATDSMPPAAAQPASASVTITPDEKPAGAPVNEPAPTSTRAQLTSTPLPPPTPRPPPTSSSARSPAVGTPVGGAQSTPRRSPIRRRRAYTGSCDLIARAGSQCGWARDRTVPLAAGPPYWPE